MYSSCVAGLYQSSLTIKWFVFTYFSIILLFSLSHIDRSRLFLLSSAEAEVDRVVGGVSCTDWVGREVVAGIKGIDRGRFLTAAMGRSCSPVSRSISGNRWCN